MEKCKICGHELTFSDTFCPECGFEVHIYPEPLSPELKSYEEERVKKYNDQREKQKELFLTMEKLKKDSEEKASSDRCTIEQLTQDLKQRAQELDKRTQELSRASEQIMLNKKEIKAQIESIQSQMKNEMERANTRAISDKAIIERLTKDLDMANRKASDIKGERPRAFILLKGGGDETVGAVYQGRNSYGCMFGEIKDSNHQELCIDGLKPIHFTIETVGERFLLQDLVGDISSANGSPIGIQGSTLTNGARFSISKNIKVTFIIS